MFNAPFHLATFSRHLPAAGVKKQLFRNACDEEVTAHGIFDERCELVRRHICGTEQSRNAEGDIFGHCDDELAELIVVTKDLLLISSIFVLFFVFFHNFFHNSEFHLLKV
jgi:hypothetical protein